MKLKKVILPDTTKRNRDMVRLKEAGLTLEEIGFNYGGLSRQRVGEIIRREKEKSKKKLSTKS